MVVVCPYCGHRMRVKGARPGRFVPKCDRCGGKFVLAISPEPGVGPMVVGIAGQVAKRNE